MRKRQIANGHQEFTGDFTTGKLERLFEQLHPIGLSDRVIRSQPGGEASMAGAHGQDGAGIHDRCIDFQFVSNNPRIIQ